MDFLRGARPATRGLSQPRNGGFWERFLNVIGGEMSMIVGNMDVVGWVCGEYIGRWARGCGHVRPYYVDMRPIPSRTGKLSPVRPG